MSRYLPVTDAANLAVAVFKRPTEAFKDVVDGVLHGEKEGLGKFMSPVSAAIGAAGLGIGIFAKDPVLMMLGTFNLAMGAGYYRGIGEERREKIESAADMEAYSDAPKEEVPLDEDDLPPYSPSKDAPPKDPGGPGLHL